MAVHSSTSSVFAVVMEASHFSGVSGCSVGMNAVQGRHLYTVCPRLLLYSSAALGESLYVNCLRIVVFLLVHGACDDSCSVASLSRSGVAVVHASSVSGVNVFVHAAISGVTWVLVSGVNTVLVHAAISGVTWVLVSGVNTVLVHATISGVAFVHALSIISGGCLGMLSSDPVQGWLWLTVFAALIDFLYSDALAST